MPEINKEYIDLISKHSELEKESRESEELISDPPKTKNSQQREDLIIQCLLKLKHCIGEHQKLLEIEEELNQTDTEEKLKRADKKLRKLIGEKKASKIKLEN